MDVEIRIRKHRYETRNSSFDERPFHVNFGGQRWTTMATKGLGQARHQEMAFGLAYLRQWWLFSVSTH